MLIVRATKKLLDRIGPPTLRDGEQSSTLLGQWFTTALPWRRQVALLVNEPTLLPVLMPLAPAATLPARAARRIAAILAVHATPGAVIEEELRHPAARCTAGTSVPTANWPHSCTPSRPPAGPRAANILTAVK